MTDIIDLIDHAIEDCGTSSDAMRWTPGPPKERRRYTPASVAAEMGALRRMLAEPLPVERPPLVDVWRPGHQLVPFVGGLWQRHLRAIPLPLAGQWHVAPPVDILTAFSTDASPLEMPNPVVYHLKRVGGVLYGREIRAEVYSTYDATDTELGEAVQYALRHRWEPGT